MYIFFSYICLLLGWVTAEHFLPWVSWHNEAFVFLAIFLTLLQSIWPIGTGVQRQVQLPSKTWLFICGFLLVWLHFSFGLIDYIGDALVFSFYIFLMLAGFAIGYGVAGLEFKGNNIYIQYVAELLLIASVCSVFLACAQVLDIWNDIGWVARMPQLRRPGANLVQPNQLATLLLMGLAGLIYLFEIRRLNTLITIVIYIVLAFGLAMTESRTGLLSLATMVVFSLALRSTWKHRIPPLKTIAGFGGSVSLFLVWPKFLALYYQVEGAGKSSFQINTHAGTRIDVWLQLIQAITERPWFGWGAGGVSKALNSVLHDYSVGESFTYAHNLVLEIAVGFGLPLTLVVCFSLAVWLWRRTRMLQTPITFYCFLMLIPFGVHSMLEFPYSYAYFLAPAMFALGVIEHSSGQVSIFLPKKIVAIVIFCISALMAWSVKEYIEVEEDFRIIRFEALHIGETPASYKQPEIYLLTQLDDLLKAARVLPVNGMSIEQLEIFRKVASRFPSIATQKRYYIALLLSGNELEACRQLRVLKALYGQVVYEEVVKIGSMKLSCI